MTGSERSFEARSEGRRTAATHANCDSCPWECMSGDGGAKERARVRRESRRHAEQTGHTIWLDFAVMDRIVGVPR